ncbi:MAG TPA: LuxR C-terminal-related transcriptional regulator [Terriglobales bacterium]|jgi:DNA-binding CsgD family transcriptional regulator
MVQTKACRPGFIVVDTELNLVASNQEAVKILLFPRAPDKLTEARNQLFAKIRSQLNGDGFTDCATSVREFRSGKRVYFCRSFLLQPVDSSGSQGLTLLLFQRRPSPLTALSEVSVRYALTPREQYAVQLLLGGLTSKEIAREMGVSPNTVKAFLRMVMVKMGVTTRSGIVGKIASSPDRTESSQSSHSIYL